MHGRKRDEYKARLADPKTAAGLAHKAQQWHALMATLIQRRKEARDKEERDKTESKNNDGDDDNNDNVISSRIATNKTTMELVEKSLLVNPDPNHLWNHRKELVQQHIILQNRQQQTQQHQQEGGEEGGNNNNSNTSSSNSSIFLGVAWKVLQQELPLTQAAIERNPKAYGAWFHRKWTIRQLLLMHSASFSTNNTTTITAATTTEEQSMMVPLLQSEIALVTTLLSLDERNFHAWNYRRYLVDALATCHFLQHLHDVSSASSSSNNPSLQDVARQMDGSWSLFGEEEGNGTSRRSIMGAQLAMSAGSIDMATAMTTGTMNNTSNIPPPTTTTTPTSTSTTSGSMMDQQHQSFLLPLVQSEWKFTQAKIEANFSNFSAFHYRGQLLPLLHRLEAASTNTGDGTSMTDRMEEEFQLIENAMCTEPDDQTAWWYHAFLLDFIIQNHGGGDASAVGGLDDDTVDYYKNRLSEQLGLLRELLSEEESSDESSPSTSSGGKWILLGLHRILNLLTENLRYKQIDKKVLDDEEQESYRNEQIQVLNRLIKVDPDRTQRYQQLLNEQQQQL